MKSCTEKACPIADNMDISRSTPAEKKAAAAALYKTGTWTMERIAEKLGVTHSAISKWLSEIVPVEQIKPAKTATNPKGAGRPKGGGKKPRQRKNSETAEERAAALVLDERKSLDAAAKEAGLGSVQVVKTAVAREEGRRQGATESAATATLSMTAKQKIDVAMRQRQRTLDQEFEQRVQTEIKQRLNDTILPHYKKKMAEADAVVKARRGAMPRALFNLILACLHPDDPMSRKKKTEAFIALGNLEMVLCKEKEFPTSTVDLPATYAEFIRKSAF